jgi:hypothetical protein
MKASFVRELALSHEKKGREEKFLCFIKTLKGIYTEAFLSSSLWGEKMLNEEQKFVFNTEKKQTPKVFRTEKLPFVSRALCYDRFLYPPLCFAVKKPGKFMWKCKQLLCISFAIFTAFATSARFIFLCF